MQAITHLRLWVTALLLAGGTSACAQSPVSQGWGIGVDASRAMGGHAVVQLEHAQSSELLWQVAAGRYVGTEIGMTPFWKGLKGEVISGSVMSLGTLVFPQQDHKLGASWFLGMDVSRESYRIQRSTEDTQLLSGATSGDGNSSGYDLGPSRENISWAASTKKRIVSLMKVLNN